MECARCVLILRAADGGAAQVRCESLVVALKKKIKLEKQIKCLCGHKSGNIAYFLLLLLIFTTQVLLHFIFHLQRHTTCMR